MSRVPTALRRASPLCLAAAVLLTSAPARAGDAFNLRDWLHRPGVRAVAVEFYATWCKPCMRAVPRWKALHEKYRRDGLRLVVINTQDPEGRCVNPGWNPDQMICDEEGDLAKAWGVGQRLPAAFVWSWQGNLLVRKGHVGEAERALKRYLRETPRVVVQASGAEAKAAVPRLRERLTDTGKVVVVAGAAERAALARIRKGSRSLRYDQAKSCAPGQEVPANALLTASVTGRRSKRLGLTLYSAQRACALAATSVPWDSGRPGRSVAEAVDKLLGKLRGPLELPGGGMSRRRPAVVERDKRDTGAADWEPEDDALAMVSFASEPSGAMVMLDNKAICQTPCKKALRPGNHRVAMHKPSYVSRDESASLKAGQTVRWKLVADFALLTVRTDPAGVPVTVDGKGVTPGVALQLSPGAHKLLAQDGCHAAHRKTVGLKRGETRTVVLRPVVKPAGLMVLASDARGSDVAGAQVWVDGRRVGPAFKALKVSVCAKEAEVRHPRLGSAKVTLSLVARKTSRVKVTLGSVPVSVSVSVSGSGSGASVAAGKAGIAWVKLPGGTFSMGSEAGGSDEKPVHRVTVSAFEIAKTEVTVGQYRACVRAGACTAPDAGKYCNWGKSGREDHPVNCVDWSQASAFSRWVGGALPTEAQWEYAARSGGRSWTHPWGSKESSCSLAVIGHPRRCTSSDPCGCGRNSTWPVCSKRAGNTRQGLCDMIGNVWEWTRDWYGGYGAGHARNPTGPSGGSYRVFRGCSWFNSASICRAAFRDWSTPSDRSHILGFRPSRSNP